MKAPGFDIGFRFEDKHVAQGAQGIQHDAFHNSPFHNMGKDADGEPIEVAQVCYRCAGHKQYVNRNYDVQKRHNGAHTLSSDWHHKQQHSTFPPHASTAERQSKRAWHALQENMERLGNAGRLPFATGVAKHLKHNTNMRKAIDLANMIGLEIYFIYGNYKCTNDILLQSQKDNPNLAAAA